MRCSSCCRVLVFCFALAGAVRGEGPGQGGPETTGTVRLLFAGDCYLGQEGRDLPLLQRHGWGWPFQGVADLVGRVDAFALNLEGPLLDGHGEGVRKKTYVYQMPERMSESLLRGRVTLAFLANNHVMDHGVPGLATTLAGLKAVGVASVGAGATETRARRPWVWRCKGQRFVFLACTTTFPLEAHARGDEAGVSGVRSVEEMTRKIRADLAAIEGPVDHAILSLHMGAELAEEPSRWHRAMARAAVESGIDLVVGHHPHVTQGIERWRGAWIVYSLGNFAFASNSRRVRGALLEVEFPGAALPSRLQWIPLEVRNDRVRYSPRVMTGSAADSACRHFLEQSSALEGRVSYAMEKSRVSLTADTAPPGGVLGIRNEAGAP